MKKSGQHAVPAAASCTKMPYKPLHSEQRSEDRGKVSGIVSADVEDVRSIAYTYTSGASPRQADCLLGNTGFINVALMVKKNILDTFTNKHSTLDPKLKLQGNLHDTSESWIPEKGEFANRAHNAFENNGSKVQVFLGEVTSMQSSEKENAMNVNNVLTMSAFSKDALQQMARLYSECLGDNIKDAKRPFAEHLWWSVNERRSQHPHRLALAFGSADEASKSLIHFADDSIGWEQLVSYAETSSTDPKLAFIFGGQCSEWYAMGRQLIEYEAVFREAILTVGSLLQDLGVSWSLINELMAPEDLSRISEHCIAQTATFAVQYATAQLLKFWKIYPSAVLGQSLGEVAAACVAGIITVKEAVQIVLIRSTLHDKCSSNGLMAAMGMSEEDTRALLIDLELSTTLNICGVNGPKMVTVAGESQSIEALGQHLAVQEGEIFWRVFGTKRAFHSYHMDEIKKPFESAMKHVKLKPQVSQIPIYSTVEGNVISGEQFHSDYWWRNIRCQVKLYQAIKQLLNDGYKQVIEISTQPILARYVKQIAVQGNQAVPTVMTTLPRKSIHVNDQHKWFLQNTICQLYTLGFSLDWKCVQGNSSPEFVRSLRHPRLDSTAQHVLKPGTLEHLGTPEHRKCPENRKSPSEK